MKKIFNFIRWFFGINILLASIGGFLSAEYIVAVFALIFGLLLIPPVWKKLRGKSSNVSQHSKSTNKPTTNSNRDDQDIYFPEDIQNAVKQVLETVNIMTTSKNIDTIVGRGDFLKQRLKTLRNASDSQRYETDVQKGLDIYKTLFYNTNVTGFQLKVVTQSDEFNFDEFYINCLLDGYERLYDDQLKAIGKLKQNQAKKRRLNKLIDKMEEVIGEIRQIGIDESYENQVSNRLGDFRYDIERKFKALN